MISLGSSEGYGFLLMPVSFSVDPRGISQIRKCNTDGFHTIGELGENIDTGRMTGTLRGGGNYNQVRVVGRSRPLRSVNT